MSLPAKKIAEIEAEEQQRFEEEKVRTAVRDKLLDQEPWRRFGKTKFAAYTNAGILVSAIVLIFIFASIWLGLV